MKPKSTILGDLGYLFGVIIGVGCGVAAVILSIVITVRFIKKQPNRAFFQLWATFTIISALTFGILNGFVDFVLVAIVIVLLSIGQIVYLFPTYVALIKQHPNFWPIAIINVIFGEIWIGWIVAMVWTLAGDGPSLADAIKQRRTSV